MDLLPFFPTQPDPDPEPITTGVGVERTISKDMDLFRRGESDFLPDNKTFEELTDQEKQDLRNKYRFSAWRPGLYSGIRWRDNLVFGRARSGVSY